ncbi:MAG: ankyrin repeat domain-containing protein, partial [Phycisphaerales bacterium]|nr:ankyrin repeat domain-containing protein [Phycisphaerales bacterium]
MAELLVQHGVSVHQTNDEGHTAVHLAAQNGQLAMIQWFHNKGANLLVRNHYGLSPFLFACSSGSVETCRFFLDHGASANDHYSNEYGNKIAAMGIASHQGHIAVVELLLERGSNSLTNALSAAVQHRRHDLARQLVARGAELPDEGKAIKFACLNNDLDMVNWLIELGDQLKNFTLEDVREDVIKQGYASVYVALLKAERRWHSLPAQPWHDTADQLLIASAQGDVTKMKHILTHSPPPDSQTIPIAQTFAKQHGRLEAQLLLSRHSQRAERLKKLAEDREEAINKAIRNSDFDMIRGLYEQGPVPGVPWTPEQRNDFFRSSMNQDRSANAHFLLDIGLIPQYRPNDEYVQSLVEELKDSRLIARLRAHGFIYKEKVKPDPADAVNQANILYDTV